MRYKIENGKIYKGDYPLQGFGLPRTYSNLVAMDKELLLLVGRHFEELKDKLDFLEMRTFDRDFFSIIEDYTSPYYLRVEDYAQYLASYLALKDDRLEALHEVIRKVEETAKGLTSDE